LGVKWVETLDVKLDAILDVKHDTILHTNIGATLGASWVQT